MRDCNDCVGDDGLLQPVVNADGLLLLGVLLGAAAAVVALAAVVVRKIR